MFFFHLKNIIDVNGSDENETNHHKCTIKYM